MNKRAPWTEEIFRLLRERPRTRDELVAKAGVLIPAGRAVRTHETHRSWLTKRRGYTRRREITTGLAAEYGRRATIAQVLHNLKRSGWITVDENPTDRGRDICRLVENRELTP